jgi:tetratricopeptide (TPR) repeat protein
VIMSRKESKSSKRGSRQDSSLTTRANLAQDLPDRAGSGFLSKRKIWISALGAAAVIVAIGIGYQLLNGSVRHDGGVSVTTFVGSGICAGCHQAETTLWSSSQHQHAMQHATDKSVLGDFGNMTFNYYNVQSRFFRKDGKFFVETDGPDGKLATFEVKYTFGLDPLQQYLIEFPDGRIQALSIAWDTRPKEQGGQRWFHLYPNEEIKFDDVLHWTKLNQNWNFMCAECHSTGLRKNYDTAHDRFATTWTEINVGCEACHGQASNHVAWARAQQSWWPPYHHDDPTKGLLARFDERQGVSWSHNPRTGEVERNLPPNLLRTEVEACGRCHVRGSKISEDWVPGRWLSDTHAVSALTRETYWADGQIRDVEEPYNYVPFKQSKMFAAGVTCSDCHDPHSGKQRAAGAGACLQCHAPSTYASVSHSHHEEAKGAPTCISCHMPARTYMVVDRRHDHSIRIPRPDLSVKLGTPNACNYCHTDKPAEWAAAAVDRWYGPERKGFQKYAEAFQSAWEDRPGAAALLAAVASDRETPAVARASALSELASRVSASNIPLVRAGLSDPDPMVRIGALDMLANVPAPQIWALAAPLLSDSVRGVRIRAVALLAAVPTESQPATDREQFERAAAEFIAAQRLNADRPESRSALGNFYAQRGRTADAEAEYKAALRLSPQYAPAASNLADFYRQLDRNGDSENVLRAAIVASPRDAGLHYALGLTLTRLKKPDLALDELRLAADLGPDQSRYTYVYAVALHSAGRGAEAMTVLRKNLAQHPNDRDSLVAAISFSRDAGDLKTALEYAERLAKLVPDDSSVAAVISDLRRQLKPPEAR